MTMPLGDRGDTTMDWTLILVFVAGLSIGTMFGVVLSGMARAAKSDDNARGRDMQESAHGLRDDME